MGEATILRRIGVLALLCALAAPGIAAAHEEDDHARAASVASGGCYVLRSEATDRYVAETPAAGYRADAPGAGGAERFLFQVTGLGRYMLVGGGGGVLSSGPLGGVRAEPQASGSSDWAVDSAADSTFSLRQPDGDKAVSADTGDGELGLTSSDAGRATSFAAEESVGCAAEQEIELSAAGRPARGETPFGEVAGFLDTHLHAMAFEFLGGRVHCGRPWSPRGVTVALTDCPDHAGQGVGAALENVLSTGTPIGFHDPVGWPTFKDWPRHDSLTHEQTYYRWMERTWKGGLRLMVNLFVENEALCDVYPLKQNSCDDMDAVRLQARRIRELEAYIDARSGGPGKGFFRIVKSPFEARKVINDGKLAVVLGIEVSSPLGCDVFNDRPACDRAQIDRQLDEVWKLGVRDMELVNKFDNALSGVAFDSGATGVAINGANLLKTGKFWQAQTCTGSDHDRSLTPGLPDGRDQLLGAGLLLSGMPTGAVPVYPRAPHCNTRGLSDLGEHLVNRMIDRGMIIDPDHMSVRARSQLLSIVEAQDYSGVVSSHSWADPTSDARILRAGGVIGPYAGSSTGYVEQWKRIRKLRDGDFTFGLGFGPDMNGFGAQGGPRPGNGANPVRYPFRSYDREVVFQRQRSGQRVFDINTDGVAHYGLYPDWIEDIRQIAGEKPLRDMNRGAEAYLQMWERASGIERRCLRPRGRVKRSGLGPVKLGVAPRRLLERVGQPLSRDGAWKWCVQGERRAQYVAALTKRGRTELVLSSARRVRAGGVRPGDRAANGGVSASGRRVVVARGGKVRYVGVATKRLSKRAPALRRVVRDALR